MNGIEGTVERGFERVRDAFAEAHAGDPGNAQLCVYHHGKVAVDLWTTRETRTERAYGHDSISITMSCSKGMTATCVQMLAQRGLLDLDAPLARYWPEFGACGKNAITVSEVISHRAGLMTFDPPLSTADLLDWDTAVEALAGNLCRCGAYNGPSDVSSSSPRREPKTIVSGDQDPRRTTGGPSLSLRPKLSLMSLDIDSYQRH